MSIHPNVVLFLLTICCESLVTSKIQISDDAVEYVDVDGRNLINVPQQSQKSSAPEHSPTGFSQNMSSETKFLVKYLMRELEFARSKIANLLERNDLLEQENNKLSIRIIELTYQMKLNTMVEHKQQDPIDKGIKKGRNSFVMPFKWPFHHPLLAGERVIVIGTPKGDFSVNFANEADESVFHFNPRFGEKEVVRNSQTPKGFIVGNEERGGGFPFKIGVPFQLEFMNSCDVIKVSNLGYHFWTFEHYVDSSKEYKYLKIEGNVELQLVQVV